MEKDTQSGIGHVSGQANEPLSRPAHALDSERVVHELETNVTTGLTPEVAAKRLVKYGSNDLGKEKGVQPLQIFIAQIVNAMSLVCFEKLIRKLEINMLT
jgi:magnesium-transporting ATPase (P-type)